MLHPWKKQSNDAVVEISAAGPAKVLPHWAIRLQPKPDALSEKSAGISGFIERGLFCLAFLPLLISLKFTPFLEFLKILEFLGVILRTGSRGSRRTCRLRRLRGFRVRRFGIFGIRFFGENTTLLGVIDGKLPAFAGENAGALFHFARRRLIVERLGIAAEQGNDRKADK
jgi:hypothetical protein